jgi:hypothetical protein
VESVGCWPGLLGELLAFRAANHQEDIGADLSVFDLQVYRIGALDGITSYVGRNHALSLVVHKVQLVKWGVCFASAPMAA